MIVGRFKILLYEDVFVIVVWVSGTLCDTVRAVSCRHLTSEIPRQHM